MNIKQKYCQLAALAGLLVALTGHAVAAEPAASDWARTDQSQVRLVAASTTTGGAETVRLGLQFRLNPGWKTYWRSPGDAGLPPRLDWTGSENLAAAELGWPAPERFELFGLDTFGYGGETVLPITARLARPGAPLNLTLKLDYLVCEKICIPYETKLTLALPTGAAQPSPYTHLIDQYVARIPGEGARVGLTIERAEWNGGAAPSITVIASAEQPFVKPEILVEGPRNDLWRGAGFTKPEAFYTEGGTRALLRLPARLDPLGDPNAPPPPEAVSGVGYVGAPVTLTLIDGARTMEFRTVLAAGPPSPPQGRAGLGAILLLALLGGLVLNLMPCVLPVLSLKLLGLIGHGGAAHGRIRRNFVASAAGIVVAFLALAAVLIALKAAGATIGWGVQFQQPVFIVAMLLLLTAFAANLWGWFEFRLPGVVADKTAAIGQGEGPGGAFLTGAFAAVLATPCSAPFVGTAVGFALANGPAEILAIFAALGLGLAAPYLAVAAIPALAARLPRPGRWMSRLRIVLGVALIASAAWLLSVLLAQTGQQTALAAGVAAAALLAVLALLHRAQLRAAVVGVAVAGAAFAVPFYLGAASPATREAGERTQWRSFDLAAIESEVRAGRLVFVDVTADWCLTCQVNKAAVLSRGEIATRLAAADVTPMRADWTRPDDAIARYLASFGRYGIPFNVVYGPGAPVGTPLPELLTTEVVLDALGRAGGRVAVVPGS